MPVDPNVPNPIPPNPPEALTREQIEELVTKRQAATGESHAVALAAVKKERAELRGASGIAQPSHRVRARGTPDAPFGLNDRGTPVKFKDELVPYIDAAKLRVEVAKQFVTWASEELDWELGIMNSLPERPAGG